jgi:hypothetical protein
VTWDQVTGASALVGGISSNDGVNFAGDLVGGAGLAFFVTKSGELKEHQTPKIPLH